MTVTGIYQPGIAGIQNWLARLVTAWETPAHRLAHEETEQNFGQQITISVEWLGEPLERIEPEHVPMVVACKTKRLSVAVSCRWVLFRVCGLTQGQDQTSDGH